MLLASPLKRFKRILVISTLVMPLAGCFTPLYKQSEAGQASSTQSMLAGIEIAPMGTRAGVELRNELMFLLNNGQAPQTPQYRMEMNITESGIISISDPVSGRPQAYATGMRVTYRVFKGIEKTPHITGVAMADTAYDRTQQRFAALRAARDAQDRAIKTVADQIRLQLAAKLSVQR